MTSDREWLLPSGIALRGSEAMIEIRYPSMDSWSILVNGVENVKDFMAALMRISQTVTK